MEKDSSQRYSNLAELAKALMPFGSTRGRQSVARIVRTVEAPGSDTGALSLNPASGGRNSMTPSAHTVRAGRTPRASLIAGLGLILVASMVLAWVNARRSRQTAAPASSVSALPATKNAVALVDTAPPVTSSSAQPAPEPSTDLALVRAPSVRPPNQTPARTSNGSAAPHPIAPAAPSSSSGTSPEVAGGSAPSPSSAHSVADVPPATPVLEAPPAASDWPFPIIEDRKHSH